MAQQNFSWLFEHVPLEKALKWIRANTPITETVIQSTEGSFEGIRLAYSAHLEPKRLPHLEFLAERGVDLHVSPCVPGIVHGPSCDHLAAKGVTIHGRDAKSWDDLRGAWNEMLDAKPNYLFDVGAGMLNQATERKLEIKCGVEATTTGITRINEKDLTFPIYDLNSLTYKSLLYNQHEVGGGVWFAFRRLTGLDIGRMRVGVIGFGPVGQSLAATARGLGARVTIADPSALKTLVASSEGFGTAIIEELVTQQDVLITATGKRGAVTPKILEGAKDGTILANAGHDDKELDIGDIPREELLPGVEMLEYKGKTFYLLAEGKILNLAGGGGSAINTFDLSTALALRILCFTFTESSDLRPGVHAPPEDFGVELLSMASGAPA